ncbi:MAG TPA: SpoIID/LytB domain-containing protein [Elusimicrobiota bacterium]|nr:SpoIID/LytB domain-containing protein [Elusimicrobiota bacterium]
MRSKLLVLSALLAYAGTALAEPAPGAGSSWTQKGNRFYFAGQLSNAVEAYRKDASSSPASLEAWLDGAVVLSELGEPEKAAQWLRKAIALSGQDPEIRVALAEAELSRSSALSALAAVTPVLSSSGTPAFAWIAEGRAELELKRYPESIHAFEEAVRADPGLTVAHYWLGKAHESAGEPSKAADAYKDAAFGDSYFVQARRRLVTNLVKAGRLSEALTQLHRLMNVDTANPDLRRLESTLRLKGARPSPAPAPAPETPAEAPVEAAQPMAPPAEGRAPILRVGIGAGPLGKPIPRKSFQFSCTSAFSIADAKTGKVLGRGEAGHPWKALAASGKKGRRIDLRGPQGRTLSVAKALVLVPEDPRAGIWTAAPNDNPEASKRLRGQLEIELLPRRGLGLVDRVDLESYTHGVLAAEMPIGSPLEALKAQAVVARTHALYLKDTLHRHHKDGFDLCDGQHCQVYSGVNLETGRSRTVVDSTRGRVATYLGQVAYLLFASNCGGHSQSGGEISGWGNVPYWRSLPDGPDLHAPRSPWELRRWLRGRPAAYCRTSSFVHASHFRWTRIVPAAELETRLDKALHVGRLKAIVALTRSVSGHVNSMQIRGSQRTATVSSELKIRGLLGIGSQRSALFLMETDRDPSGRPAYFVFYGGGWGHGVGMCQSGAMGRAEAGQSYQDILQAYYPGTELGNLRY